MHELSAELRDSTCFPFFFFVSNLRSFPFLVSFFVFLFFVYITQGLVPLAEPTKFIPIGLRSTSRPRKTL